MSKYIPKFITKNISKSITSNSGKYIKPTLSFWYTSRNLIKSIKGSGEYTRFQRNLSY